MAILLYYSDMQVLKLNIIIPLSRIKNLKHILKNIKESLKKITPLTYIILDPRIKQNIDTTDIYYLDTVESSFYGTEQRNLALDNINDGYIYFLDDDNLIHPNFENILLESINKYKDKKGFVFNQIRKNGTIYLTAKLPPTNYQIDTGNVVLDRSLIGDIRWEKEYNHDFLFFAKVYNTNPDKFITINKIATYYNAIRD